MNKHVVAISAMALVVILLTIRPDIGRNGDISSLTKGLHDVLLEKVEKIGNGSSTAE